MKRHLLINVLYALPPLFLLTGTGPSQYCVPLPPPSSSIRQPHFIPNYGKLPLAFEPNQGQTDPQVKFLARGRGYAIYLTPAEAVFVLERCKAPKASGFKTSSGGRQVRAAKKLEVLRLRLAGGNRKAAFDGLEESGGKSNYFTGGNPANWHTGVPQYAKVRMKEVYPGINMIYYGSQNKLEYDFVIAPGADPKAIALEYQDAGSARVDPKGNLVFHLAQGDMTFEAPLAYQEHEVIKNGKRAVIKTKLQSRYVMGKNRRIGFETGVYDKNLPLVIDPALAYSTYLGGSGDDEANGIAVDSSGNAYVTGSTSGSFPTTSGASQTSYAGGSLDVFVSKLNAAGSGLLYSTYLGGIGYDVGNAIAVDSSGNAYVTGSTTGGFPTTSGAFHTVVGGGIDDGFMAKLNASGTQLLYSTYFGGSFLDIGYGIAVDGSGNAYVTGNTGGGFPTTSGAYQTSYGGGSYDAFVAKLNPAGGGVSDLVYSTYLGGNGTDSGFGIAVDGSGNAYVTGYTYSTNFPTTSGVYQTALDGTEDAFVTKLNASGSALLYSTYLGGSGNNIGYGLALDSSGNVYVTGYTSGGFPTTSGAYQTVFGGGNSDAFVAKLNGLLSALLYSTYLGGGGTDWGTGIAVDGSGNAYVTGNTTGSFPTTGGAYQATYGGGVYDVFLTKVNPAGGGPGDLVYSTYLGGSGNDYGKGIAWDPSGNAHIAGYTNGNFPNTSGVYQTGFGGVEDSFIAEFSFPNLTPVPTPTPTPCGYPGITCTPTNTPLPTATPTSTPTGVLSGMGKAVLAPVPVVSGEAICLYPDSPVTSSHWDVFNFIGEEIKSLDFTGSQACWNTMDIGTGVYVVRLKLTYTDGHSATCWQKIIVKH